MYHIFVHLDILQGWISCEVMCLGKEVLFSRLQNEFLKREFYILVCVFRLSSCVFSLVFSLSSASSFITPHISCHLQQFNRQVPAHFTEKILSFTLYYGKTQLMKENFQRWHILAFSILVSPCSLYKKCHEVQMVFLYLFKSFWDFAGII